MNQPQTESAQVPPTSPTHDGIPGIARVEPIAIPPSGVLGERKSLDTVLGVFVSNLLKIISRTLSPELIETILEFSKKFGHSAVLGGAGLTFVYAIYGGIKYNSFATFAIGLGFVAAMAVAQYAAIRFLGAAHSVISGTPSRVSSTAFLDCIWPARAFICRHHFTGRYCRFDCGKEFSAPDPRDDHESGIISVRSGRT